MMPAIPREIDRYTDPVEGAGGFVLQTQGGEAISHGHGTDVDPRVISLCYWCEIGIPLGDKDEALALARAANRKD